MVPRRARSWRLVAPIGATSLQDLPWNGARYTFATNEGIPGQWQRFEPYVGNVPNQDGPETYGVCCNADNSGSFEYIAGVRVSEFHGLPEGFATVRISAQRYAIFRHPAHELDAFDH